jgi:hypothetical protein
MNSVAESISRRVTGHALTPDKRANRTSEVLVRHLIA